MLKNYFKTALKVLWRHKLFTFISLFGISFTLLILMVATSFVDHALGAVAPVPVRTREAESMLLGKKPQADILERVAECAVKEIRPISDVRGSAEYRMTLSRILVEQALKEAVTVVPV